MGTRFQTSLFIGVISFFAASPASSQSTPSQAVVVQEILATTNNQTDLAAVKLKFDKLIDPKIDIESLLKQIDAMAQTVSAMSNNSPSSAVKLATLRRYIYENGAWNENRPYSYDHDDPLGTKISNKLLTNYIAQRRGNCVTMPFLFIILAERIGLRVTASEAPLHVLVKYTDETTGTIINLEATSGALPSREVWYRQTLPMTDEAIANGLYLRPLSKTETVALMATVLLDYDLEEGKFQDAIEVADVILAYYPKSVYAMVKQGSAYGHLLEHDFYQKYPTPKDIPLDLRTTYQFLAQKNAKAFEKAESLGWRPVN